MAARQSQSLVELDSAPRPKLIDPLVAAPAARLRAGSATYTSRRGASAQRSAELALEGRQHLLAHAADVLLGERALRRALGQTQGQRTLA